MKGPRNLLRKGNVEARFLVFIAITAAFLFGSRLEAQTLLFGDQTAEPQLDSNPSGQAEAFQTTAVASGTLSTVTFYADARSDAAQVFVGVYTDSNGHPGSLLTSASTSPVTAGHWNTLTVSPVSIMSGTKYWIAVLGTGSGTVFFHDRSGGPCLSQASSQTNLTSLPATWSQGAQYTDCPVSAYGSASAVTQPILTLSTNSLSFGASQGGPNPSTATVNLTNTGSGTLSFTVASDQTWLTGTPTSGTAPQALTVGVTTGSLVAGTYIAHLTVTATGAQGSPATITVTFVVSPPPPPQPVLSVSPSSLTFAATTGGGNPASQSLSVTNTGGGTLSFSANTDQTWLGVLPGSGTAPQSLTVTATTGSLAAGTYMGHVTVSASGAQGSPSSITVTFNVSPASASQPGDWLMIEHDPGRSGFASDETIISTSDVGNLVKRWSTTLDGQVTAQPLFAGGVQINGGTHDVVIAASSGNSIYALDANTGAQLWKRNFGSQPTNCVFTGGFGITGSPLIDRNANRVYAVSDDGQLRSMSLFDGTDAAPALPVITSDTTTNKVWGGLNEFGSLLYIPTASDGCDSRPWRGRVFQVNLSGSAPTIQNTFTVVPSIAAPSGGGGIWGYGGVSVDTATNRVYAASGQDSNTPETLTLNSDSMLALDASLNLLGAFQASHPTPFPCGGEPCDLDFASTPVVFNPPSCPTMLAAGNKNGILYLFRATDLAASGQPLQSLMLNTANDSLGAGGIGGTSAYWPAANMLFVGDTGPGVTGVNGGLVALKVQPNCTLQTSWSVALATGAPNSTPTLANGVVFIAEASTGTLRAYDATTGTALWNSGTAISGPIFAGPMVAKGWVYAGSWGSGTANGAITAFSLNAASGPILNVSTSSLSFSAVQGGANPQPANISITNTGTGSLTFGIASNQPWLSASPSSGAAPQTVGVTATTGTLTAGTYTGHLTIAAAGAQGSPATVTVTFVVSPQAQPPMLSVTPASLTFSATQGGANPASNTASVTNTGGGVLSFTAASDQAWLSVSPTSGTAPQTLTVSTAISGLAVGTYTGHITVTSAGVAGSPFSLTVTLNVGAASAVLFGTQTIGSFRDSNSQGSAEAFQATATGSGTLGSLSVYVDTPNTATKLVVGLYADSNGHPGTLLTQASTTSITAGAWNKIVVPQVGITNGTKYWIAILGTQSGSLAFRSTTAASCGDEGSSQTNLTALPATWSTGPTYGNCPLSGYGSTP